MFIHMCGTGKKKLNCKSRIGWCMGNYLMVIFQHVGRGNVCPSLQGMGNPCSHLKLDCPSMVIMTKYLKKLFLYAGRQKK